MFKKMLETGVFGSMKTSLKIEKCRPENYFILFIFKKKA